MRRSPLVNAFLHYLKVERALSSNTIQAYSLDMVRLQRWTSENKTSLRSLTERDLEHWLGDLSRARLNPKSIRRALSSTRSFFQFLVLDNHIDTDPTVNLTGPKTEQLLPSILTPSEVTRLLETPNLSSLYGLRDRAFLETLYAAGLRISEAITLRHQDVDLETRILLCHGKGNKERQVPIGRQAVEWLQRYLNSTFPQYRRPTGRVFLNQGNPFTRQFAWALIHQYATLAKLKNVTPHTLRHSFATHLLQNGAKTTQVQILLGHSHLSTTEIYTRVTPQYLRASYDQHHPRSSSSSSGSFTNDARRVSIQNQRRIA